MTACTLGERQVLLVDGAEDRRCDLCAVGRVKAQMSDGDRGGGGTDRES